MAVLREIRYVFREFGEAIGNDRRAEVGRGSSCETRRLLSDESRFVSGKTEWEFTGLWPWRNAVFEPDIEIALFQVVEMLVQAAPPGGPAAVHPLLFATLKQLHVTIDRNANPLIWRATYVAAAVKAFLKRIGRVGGIREGRLGQAVVEVRVGGRCLKNINRNESGTMRGNITEL